MRVVCIGGGPSGSFCAIGLLRGETTSQRPEVLIFDRKFFAVHGPRGCNLCAGVISNSLVQCLESIDLSVPPQVIQNEIKGYHLVSRGGSVRLQKERGARIFTAYRAAGPPDSRYAEERSFDRFLLNQAVSLGAIHVRELVTDIRPLGGSRGWRVEYGGKQNVDADVVVIGCGVHTMFLKRIAGLGFGYRSPMTIHACQAEIPLGREAVAEYMQNEIKIFALGLPGVKFAAMTPKEEHVTVTLVGRHVTHADLEDFLKLPSVSALLPSRWSMPDSHCHCHPLIPVSAGRPAVADGLVIVGDAYVSRYLKNGLVSAFQTGMQAARAILNTGGDREGLRRDYVRPCEDSFRFDNVIGRLLFRLQDAMARSPRISNALLRVHHSEQLKESRILQAASSEAENEAPGLWLPATRLLWNMFTGDLPYVETLKPLLDPGLGLRVALNLFSGDR